MAEEVDTVYLNTKEELESQLNEALEEIPELISSIEHVENMSGIDFGRVPNIAIILWNKFMSILKEFHTSKVPFFKKENGKTELTILSDLILDELFSIYNVSYNALLKFSDEVSNVLERKATSVADLTNGFFKTVTTAIKKKVSPKNLEPILSYQEKDFAEEKRLLEIYLKSTNDLENYDYRTNLVSNILNRLDNGTLTPDELDKIKAYFVSLGLSEKLSMLDTMMSLESKTQTVIQDEVTNKTLK